MKTQTCLIVREDGVIAIGEFPEYPTKPGPMSHQEFFKEYYEDDLPAYYKALKEAMQSAVEVAPEDQELAEKLIYRTDGIVDGLPVNYYHWRDEIRKIDHPYPIPGIRYEVRGTLGGIVKINDQTEGAMTKKLAYIIEPPPERPDIKKEGQKEPTFAQFLGKVLEMIDKI